MRKSLTATLVIMLVAVVFTAPAATATHVELSQQRDYVNANTDQPGFRAGTRGTTIGPFGPFGFSFGRSVQEQRSPNQGPLCTELPFDVYGACFELTGRESEIDIGVEDRGHHHLWRADKLVLTRAIDRTQTELDGGNDLANDVIDLTADIAKDVYCDEVGISCPTVNSTVDTATGPVKSEKDTALDDLNSAILDPLDDFIDESIEFQWIHGIWQFRNAGGGIITQAPFCNTAMNLKVPAGATQLTVFFRGFFHSNPWTGFAEDSDEMLNPVLTTIFGTEVFVDLDPDSSPCGFNPLTEDMHQSSPQNIGFTQPTFGTVFMRVSEDP